MRDITIDHEDFKDNPRKGSIGSTFTDKLKELEMDELGKLIPFSFWVFFITYTLHKFDLFSPLLFISQRIILLDCDILLDKPAS